MCRKWECVGQWLSRVWYLFQLFGILNVMVYSTIVISAVAYPIKCSSTCITRWSISDDESDPNIHQRTHKYKYEQTSSEADTISDRTRPSTENFHHRSHDYESKICPWLHGWITDSSHRTHRLLANNQFVRSNSPSSDKSSYLTGVPTSCLLSAN